MAPSVSEDCFSNLTTIYPKLAFGRKAASQIMERFEDEQDLIADTHDGLVRLVKKDFIPAVPFQTSNGRIGNFRVHISYTEANDTKKLWKSYKKKFRGASGRSAILSGCDNETHGFNILQLYQMGRDGLEPCEIADRDGLHTKNGCLEFHFTLAILLQELPPELLIPAPRSEENCKRTALLARELIGGYRRIISLIQYYAGYTDELPKMANGHASASDFHATHEDADRLIAHFQFLRAELRSLGIDPLELSLSKMAKLKKLADDHEHNFEQIVSCISNRLAVSPATISRKLFEYAVYVDLVKS